MSVCKAVGTRQKEEIDFLREEIQFRLKLESQLFYANMRIKELENKIEALTGGDEDG